MEMEIHIQKSADYDVIVVGSGPAGIGASLAAARGGARTLLVESLGRVGGISTSGLMSHFVGRVGSPIYHEILSRSADKNPFDRGVVTKYIDPELLTLTYIEMLEEAGVDLLLYTQFCDVFMDGKTVTGILCHNKDGFCRFGAKVVIDASGDGDVAYAAGVPFDMGREEDGKMQPATLMFKLGGVDTDRAVYLGSFERKYETPRGELQALAHQLLPHPAGHVLLYRSTLPGIVTVNMTNVTDIDGTSAADLTHAECVCRRQIPVIVEFLREYAPGYENCFVIGTASLIGVRETRRFRGVKTLTAEEISSAVLHDDAVVFDAYFNFDVHNITGSGLDKTGVQHKFTQKNGYTIPYGCLVPLEVDGLLLSGRNISGTHMAHSNYRAMPICMGIGVAAGTAAALAVAEGIAPRALDVKKIQERVK